MLILERLAQASIQYHNVNTFYCCLTTGQTCCALHRIQAHYLKIWGKNGRWEVIQTHQCSAASK